MNVERLYPKLKKGSFFVETSEKKRVRARQVEDIYAKGSGFGAYEFTRDTGRLIKGIRFACLCGCGEIQELDFDAPKSRLHGGWNGRFEQDEIQVIGNRVSIIDGFWVMKYE